MQRFLCDSKRGEEINMKAILYFIGSLIEMAFAVYDFSTGRTNNAIIATVAAICFLLTAILEKSSNSR